MMKAEIYIETKGRGIGLRRHLDDQKGRDGEGGGRAVSSRSFDL